MASKRDLIEYLLKEGHFQSLAEAERNVSVIFSSIKEMLLSDEHEEIGILGFGKFTKKISTRANPRNPKTGESIDSKEIKSVKYTISRQFKISLNDKG